LLETLNTGVGGFTTGSASDSTGNLYVTNFSAGSVTKFTGPGDPHTPSIFLNQSGAPESILFDKSGNVFVSSAGTGFIGKYSAAGALLTSFNTGKGRADWIDLSGDQSKIFFTIDIQKGVFVLDLGTSAVTTFNASVGNFALRLLGDGGLLVANQQDIKRLDSAGAVITTYDAPGEDDWFALNLDPDGTTFWSGDFGTGDFCQFNISGGAAIRCKNTGTGGGSLFGLSVFGEITQGGGGPPPTTGIPEPSSLVLLGVGLLLVLRVTRHP
jgi:DNA-binding beta-propeller fold protein YncE